MKEGDIIDAIPGKNIYASFISDMNELQASTTYDRGNFKWKTAAYDWRLSLNDIVHNGVDRDGQIYYEEASSTPYIEQTLRQLASTSATGKVTIVAHSNGGLVTKALLQKLGDTETASLVDKIIFVGVPQAGAPQALGGLLFGNREGLPNDLFPVIATPAVTRGLAEYSPMAYHLIPSDRYFRDVQDPNHSIIGFSGSILYPKERSAYGTSIDTITELDNFLLANEGGRTKPEANDATTANILNQGLITYAHTTHDSLDSWIPPSSVTLYQIAGWGADTVSGIDFYDEQKVLGITVGHKRLYRPVFVEDGDGVVPVPSALMTNAATNVHNYWLDLARQAVNNLRRDHGNIFEVDELRKFVSNIMAGNETIPNYILSSVPLPIPGSRLIFQLHSPLTLGLYDASGNYTGLNSDGSVSKEVAGVTYGEFGDVKYIIAPAGTQYELAMNGQTDGVFSLDIQEQTGNSLTTTTIADVPTTSTTVARLTITNGAFDASALSVDSDGDGTEDFAVTIESGETVQYTEPITVSEETKETQSGSISTKNYVQSIPSIAIPAFTVPSITTGVALAQRSQILSTQTKAELPQDDEPKTLLEQPSARTQTASVYDAFAPFAVWFKTVMYNVWKNLLYFLNLL